MMKTKTRSELQPAQDKKFLLEIVAPEPGQENYNPEIEEDVAARFEKLDNFGQSVAKTRADAISARQTSGIEKIWSEDEDFYEGIDDINRSMISRTSWHTKVPGKTISSESTKNRSLVFPNITGPFVDTGSSRLTDITLPAGEPSWKLENTPIPDMIRAASGKFENPAPDTEEAQKLQQGKIDQAQLTIDKAKEAARLGSKRINDWHKECKFNRQVRRVVDDAARIGVGVLKGPIPEMATRISWDSDKNEAYIIEKDVPVTKWVDPWNFYPDGACGEDIHKGAHTWEFEFITNKQLRAMKDEAEFNKKAGLPSEGYIPEQIDRCLSETAMRITGEYQRDLEKDTSAEMKTKFQVWYFYGTAEREDLEAAGVDLEGINDPHFPVMITMVNNHIIRAELNILDTGVFPYDTFRWRRRGGHWTGIGIARQMRVAQEIIVGGCRNLMENAGLAAGPMIVFRQGTIFPVGQKKMGIGPRRIFYIAKNDEMIKDATKAIGVIKVDMLVDDLLKIINFGMKLAEDITGMPALLQGQMGKAPDTVGGMQILNNNATSPIRSLARDLDDDLFEPHIDRYHQYLLLYGENNSEKGDFFVDATGSSALVEKDMQNSELINLQGIVSDIRFGLNPKKYAVELLRARHFDPAKFAFAEDDKEYQQILEGMANPPDSKLEIAEIKRGVEELRIDAGLRAAGLNAQVQISKQEQAKIISDEELQLEALMAGFQGEIENMRDDTSNKQHIDKLKADLFKHMEDIRATRQLVQLEARADRLPAPVVEPPGKAKAGSSMTQ